MNKQSNLYTIIYIFVLVAIVGTALAFTSISLKSRQQANAAEDKMRQILASVNITPDAGESVRDAYARCIFASCVVDSEGKVLEGKDIPQAFDVNVANQVKLPDDKRLLPVFECRVPGSGEIKYILPLYGAGLWGPIWGYVSLDSDATTIYGAYFAHQGETPGLGAEIEKPTFSGQFAGKVIFKNQRFMPVEVVKAGQVPQDGSDYVDGVSGGTITSKGVSAMLGNCLTPYASYLEFLRNKH